MARKLTEDDARESITDHARAKGFSLRDKYGPDLQLSILITALEDREFIRYPCRIVYDATLLQPGEFAFPVALGTHPNDGFDMVVHPALKLHPEWVVYALLYQLVAVNYGDFASPHDAEAFGAAALGLTDDEYYRRLCALADALAEVEERGFLLIQEPNSIPAD